MQPLPLRHRRLNQVTSDRLVVIQRTSVTHRRQLDVVVPAQPNHIRLPPVFPPPVNILSLTATSTTPGELIPVGRNLQTRRGRYVRQNNILTPQVAEGRSLTQVRRVDTNTRSNNAIEAKHRSQQLRRDNRP